MLEELSRTESRLTIKFSEARNLAFLREKKKEGVVYGWMMEAYGGTTPVATTQYCWKEDEDPFWGEESASIMFPHDCVSFALRYVTKMKDTPESDQLLRPKTVGSLQLGMEQFKSGEMFEAWHKLYKQDKKGSVKPLEVEIKIAITYEVVAILPGVSYTKISEYLFRDSDFAILSALATLCPSSIRTQFATLLAALLNFTKTETEFLMKILVAEINACATEQVLFRSNSVGTKAFEFYLKNVGQELYRTLQPVIDAVVEVSKTARFELAAAKMIETDDPDINLSHLLIHLKQTMSVITSPKTLEGVATSTRRILHAIRSTTAAKFPAANAQITGVTGFFFLRFWVPAILTPKLFGLADIFYHAEHPASRNLTLIASTLQKASNLNQYEPREAKLNLLNPYLNEEMIPQILAVINVLTSTDSPTGCIEAPVRPIDYESYLARLLLNMHGAIMSWTTDPNCGIDPSKTSKFVDELAKLKAESDRILSTRVYEANPPFVSPVVWTLLNPRAERKSLSRKDSANKEHHNRSISSSDEKSMKPRIGPRRSDATVSSSGSFTKSLKSSKKDVVEVVRQKNHPALLVHTDGAKPKDDKAEEERAAKAELARQRELELQKEKEREREEIEKRKAKRREAERAAQQQRVDASLAEEHEANLLADELLGLTVKGPDLHLLRQQGPFPNYRFMDPFSQQQAMFLYQFALIERIEPVHVNQWLMAGMNPVLVNQLLNFNHAFFPVPTIAKSQTQQQTQQQQLQLLQQQQAMAQQQQQLLAQTLSSGSPSSFTASDANTTAPTTSNSTSSLASRSRQNINLQSGSPTSSSSTSPNTTNNTTINATITNSSGSPTSLAHLASLERKPLTQSSGASVSGRMQATPTAEKNFAMLAADAIELCEFCLELITDGTALKVQDKFFHKDCFVCANPTNSDSCARQLDKVYYRLGPKLVCQSCYDNFQDKK